MFISCLIKEVNCLKDILALKQTASLLNKERIKRKVKKQKRKVLNKEKDDEV